VTAYIDGRVHPPVAALLDGPLAPFLPGLEGVGTVPQAPLEPDEVAEFFRSRDARAVLLGWDSEATTNRRPFSNDDVAALVAGAPDVFIGFGAVDAAKGAAAVAQVHEAARIGLSGLAMPPATQHPGPADRATELVWEAAAGHGLTCLFHTGVTRLGAGMPGGAGVRLSSTNPLIIDKIAARLPELRIVLAHTGRLWRAEAFAIAAHKPNVFLSLGGDELIGPDAADLREAVTGPLKEKILFGSGYPFGDPDKWRADWSALGLSDDVLQKVLYDNAAGLLGIES
jgi:predicted TIM-barrel fold metal-dependent hydrolase